jgi:hypothetical protein
LRHEPRSGRSARPRFRWDHVATFLDLMRTEARTAFERRAAARARLALEGVRAWPKLFRLAARAARPRAEPTDRTTALLLLAAATIMHAAAHHPRSFDRCAICTRTADAVEQLKHAGLEPQLQEKLSALLARAR